VRRLLGATPNDETSGPLIVYDQGQDTFTVNGSPVPPNASVTSQSSGRVRAVLTPKPASATTEEAPAGKGLRPSTTLGGDVSQ
jgi:lipopolysaccharide export system protein LptA